MYSSDDNNVTVSIIEPWQMNICPISQILDRAGESRLRVNIFFTPAIYSHSNVTVVLGHRRINTEAMLLQLLRSYMYSPVIYSPLGDLYKLAHSIVY